MNTQLETTLEHYATALEKLKPDESAIEVEEVLRVLNARDAVQAALKEQKSIPTCKLQKVIQLDTALRENAVLINKKIKPEQFTQWRESIQPSAEAWWWRLDSLAPPHPWDNLDWLWKLLYLAGWTANISLLVNIATRFLGSGGVGLFGAAAVTLPSILTLLQASSELTKAGEEGFEKLLEKLKIPKHYKQEVKLASTLAMSGILISFWFALPAISDIYNRNGLKNHDEKDLGAAEQNYQRATSLNADNVEAHYNLGNLYEDWQDWEKAKKQYQIAVAGGLPDAYNNLARLYIREKKYPEAASLLAKGLEITNTPDYKKLEVRYSLFKNLGWVRFSQARYTEAQEKLKVAIDIANRPEAQKYITNPGAAHCLLAQVLEKQKQSTAIKQWRKCADLGSILNPDEDTWLHLARGKLRKAGK
ncbi:tetratricopeptide repeat protein [Scytonema sp. PCC 10023]|uniref:tetratricopeptide repeat protein n=1 Tax=Scytonema sp. PCC 10023 TaxID=1680591 RepID=UPI0039C60313